MDYNSTNLSDFLNSNTGLSRLNDTVDIYSRSMDVITRSKAAMGKILGNTCTSATTSNSIQLPTTKGFTTNG